MLGCLRVPHLGLDVCVEGVVLHPAQLGGAVDARLLSLADDAQRNAGADLADTLDARVDEIKGALFRSEGVSETERSGLNHAIRDRGDASENGAETDTLEFTPGSARARRDVRISKGLPGKTYMLLP